VDHRETAMEGSRENLEYGTAALQTQKALTRTIAPPVRPPSGKEDGFLKASKLSQRIENTSVHKRKNSTVEVQPPGKVL